MKGNVYRRCGCRNRETGLKYGPGQCPRLNSRKRADQDHGTWWARYDAPARSGQTRRQPTLGPFNTKAEAEEALAAEISRISGGASALDTRILVKDYLETWLKGKRSLKKETWDSYEEVIQLYFTPAFGHIKLWQLRKHHVEDLVTALGQINRSLPEGEKPSELLLRLIDARADDERRELAPGETRHKKSTKPLSPARIKRIMAVLSSALNSAVKSGQLGSNPAAYVELPRIRGKNKVKPMVWTKQRVQRWLVTGKAPGPVMVWTPKQTGLFLDFIMEERLYALYHLTAFRGLRRGEIAGLPRAEVDLEEALLTVLVTAPDDDDDYNDDDPDDPKSDAGSRTMSLDPVTVEVLQAWFERQDDEQAEAGSSWVDSGLVFTQPDGSPLRETWISERFEGLIDKYTAIRRGHKDGKTVEDLARKHRASEDAVKVALTDPLPPIRFHDLRHGAATLSLAANVDIKVVSETLGHAKSSFTRDTYSSVIPEVAQAAAEAVAAIVPRSRRAS